MCSLSTSHTQLLGNKQRQTSSLCKSVLINSKHTINSPTLRKPSFDPLIPNPISLLLFIAKSLERVTNFPCIFLCTYSVKLIPLLAHQNINDVHVIKSKSVFSLLELRAEQISNHMHSYSHSSC